MKWLNWLTYLAATEFSALPLITSTLEGKIYWATALSASWLVWLVNFLSYHVSQLYSETCVFRTRYISVLADYLISRSVYMLRDTLGPLSSVLINRFNCMNYVCTHFNCLLVYSNRVLQQCKWFHYHSSNTRSTNNAKLHHQYQ